MTQKQFEQLDSLNKDHIILIELEDGSYWLRNINGELLEIDEKRQYHWKEITIHQLSVFKHENIVWYE